MGLRERLRTFRSRIVLLVLVTGAVTAILVCAAVLTRNDRRERREVLEAITSQAEVVAIHCAAALRFQDPAAIQETLNALLPIEHLDAAVVFDAQGRPVARFERDGAVPAPEIVARPAGHRQEGAWLLVTESIRHEKDTLGTLVIAYDTSWLTQAFLSDMVYSALLTLLAVGIGVVVALPLQSKIADPVGELVSVAQNVASGGDFSVRARRFADDELGAFTTVFNEMLARIERHSEDIRQANERYDLVNLATNDVLWDWDLESDRLHWSQAAERSFGYTLAELGETSRERLERIHPEDAPRVAASLQDAIAGTANTWTGEYRFRRHDGSYGVYIDRGIIGRDATKHAYRIVGSMVDLTERQRAEAAIQEAADRLRSLMNAIPAFVWVAGPDGRVVEFNERWYEYTGLSVEQSREDGWLQIVHPLDQESSVRRWQDALRTGSSYTDERRLRSRDGGYRWFMARALPVRDSAGSPIGWYGTSIDIEDRKRIEDERDALLASERVARTEAEQASRTKDEFLATLSHELRTPLTAILGWAQVLSKLDAVMHDKDVAEGVGIIERNARVQTQLIADLLDMSRITSGKLRLDVQVVDLLEVIDEAMKTVQPAADAKEIRLQRILDPHVGPVHGDPGRLQQVVWNLLANAVKFTPKGGRVQVALERVSSQIEINVRDSGQGIEPEFIPHLFERFRQADASTTRMFGGLGLGLAIVKHLVELHGGTVRASSPGEGKGATFTVILPPAIVHSRPEADEHQPGERGPRVVSASHAPSLSGVRVLVVEDDPDARALVARLLRQQDAEVHPVGSAADALQALASFRPDVLVSDIGMPVMDGHELIREIRGRLAAEGGNVPALALTAFARTEDRARALLAGYEMHMAKPVEPAELLVNVSILARLARGQRQTPPVEESAEEPGA